jgi:hypothetical protein
VLGLVIFAGSVVYTPAATLRVPRDYPSIQAGLTAAHTGDTVLVAAGIYHESLTLKPGVHLHGEPGTILDGSGTAGSLVSALSGIEPSAVLSGFVIRRGRRAGILLNQASPTIRNNVIIDNGGAGIACLQASPHLVNNVITRNAGGGIVCQYPGTAPVIVYNDLWQNWPTDYQGCTPGEGNRRAEPRFVDAQHDDYRLQNDSTLIDAGDPAVTLRDADGSRSDIGAYGGPQPSPKPQAERFVKPEVLRNSLSFQGFPGIIDTPTATMVPPGHFDVGYNVKRDFNVFPGVDEQQNLNIAIGLLPRVTIGARGTVANAAGGVSLAGDISANLQLLLLQEGLWWPSIALGMQDIGGGATHFRSNYLVLSKSFLGHIRTTVGVGSGPDTLDGLFGGVEVALNRYITLMGEYDTDDFNFGLRLFPLPQQLEAYGIPRPTVDLIWQDGNHFSWGISFRTGIGEAKFRAQRAALADKRYYRITPPAGGPVDLQAVSEELQAQLLNNGLENVRVSMVPLAQDTMVVVEYENRRYNRNELDGLGVVLGLTATRMPPVVTYIRAIVKSVNIPVLQFTTGVDDFLAFVNEHMSASTFASRIQITNQVQPPTTTSVAATSIANRSWLKLDVFLRPKIDTTILTERGVADVRFSLLPDAVMQLLPGAEFNIQATIPVTKTANFPGALGAPEVSRVLLHQALRLPLGQWSRFAAGLTQFSIGLFNVEEAGIANETALTFLEGVLFVKGTLALVGSSFADLDRWIVLGNGRVRYPPWDLTLSLTGGRFRDGDTGIEADLSRFFGNTEVGVFLRHSDNGSLGGIRVGFPLTLGKELKPTRLRPRLPDLFTYEQRTTVFTDRNVLRFDIGRTLPTGHTIERVYWNRDRLYPAYIRQHVNILKGAVRRWVDEETAIGNTQGRN